MGYNLGATLVFVQIPSDLDALRLSDAPPYLHRMNIRRQQLILAEARNWLESGQCYAILDACATPAIVERMKGLGDENAVSLYRGSAEEQFESVAPFLVSVDAPTFEWITSILWTQPWGVLVRSPADVNTLRTHFRKFLMVESPEKKRWYFRFYDPRVLETYLHSCTEGEIEKFFGPVSAFGVASTDSDVVMAYTRPLVTGSHIRVRINH